MNELLTEYLRNGLERSRQPVMFFRKEERHCFYANILAVTILGDETGTVDIYRIFQSKGASPFLRSAITAELLEKPSVMVYDVPLTSNQGKGLLSDVQVAYADEEHQVLVVEIFIKEDDRMDMAHSQVNQSIRAEGILEFDETFTLIYGNDLFHAVFGLVPKLGLPPSKKSLSHGLLPEDRETVLEEIHKNLEQSPTYYSKIKILTEQGEEKWYSLELQRRALDDSGKDKIMAYLVNIENQVEIEERLETVNQYFSAIQALSDDMLYRVDLSTKTLFRTSDQAKMFGISATMPNYPASIVESGIIHPEDEKHYLKYGNDLLEGKSTQAEVRIKSNDGQYGFRRLSCTPVYDKKGNIKEMFGKIVNIQKVRELEEKANYDALTSALNKRAMLESTSQILERALKEEKHALFFMDLDNFKYVNDSLGHSFGDYLLAELGKRLCDSVRGHDLVGRVGGDEFVIFLRDVPSEDMVMGKAKMLLSTISEDFFDGSSRHNIQGSLGIAVFPDHGTSYEELYHHADLALYSSKHKGKNRVTMFHAELKQEKD